MVNRRRAPHRGRLFPHEFQFLAELILTVGAVVCFILMVVVLLSRGGAVYDRSMAALLGMQM